MDNSKREALRKYIDAQSQISKRIRHSIKPFEILKKNLNADMQTYSEIAKTLEESNRVFVERQKELAESIAKASQIDFKVPNYSRLVTDYQSSFRNVLGPAIEIFQKSMEELPPKLKDALVTLSDSGWYMDMEMPIDSIWEIVNDLNDGNVEDVDLELTDYFNEKQAELLETIAEKYPNREHIVRSALTAHERKEYYLSIPVLLAQSDGICKNAVGHYLFMKQNQKPKVALYVETLTADTFQSALLSPLTVSAPIHASEHQRGPGFNQLNRHMVLHGESLDYGTELNGAKAISLINYVSQVLSE